MAVDVELMIKKIIGRKDGIKITVEVNVKKRHWINMCAKKRIYEILTFVLVNVVKNIKLMNIWVTIKWKLKSLLEKGFW